MTVRGRGIVDGLLSSQYCYCSFHLVIYRLIPAKLVGMKRFFGHELLLKLNFVILLKGSFVFLFHLQQKSSSARFTMIFELGSNSPSAANISRPSVNDLNSSTLAQIAEYVASTGETLNIHDVNEWLKDKPIYHPQQQQPQQQPHTHPSQHQAEGQGSSGGTGGTDDLSAKNLLCMPIVNGQQAVIGVAQLINKVSLTTNPAKQCFPNSLFCVTFFVDPPGK